MALDLVDETTLMLGSTTVKVHQHGSGAKPGGDGWAWEFIALFALEREPKRQLYGAGVVGALCPTGKADFDGSGV